MHMNALSFNLILFLSFIILTCEKVTSSEKLRKYPLPLVYKTYNTSHERQIKKPAYFYSGSDAQYFLNFCTTPQTAAQHCSHYDAEDWVNLKLAQEKVRQFQEVLHQYYDFTIQIILVIYCYVCGIYLIVKKHFDFHSNRDIHYLKPTSGIEYFNYKGLDYTIEEVKTIVQTDSEEGEMIEGVNLDDFIYMSDEEDFRFRKKNLKEYENRKSRRRRHMDDGGRIIVRNEKPVPNLNDEIYGTRIRSLLPPKGKGKRFDFNGVPKYPIVIEIRRDVNKTNPNLERL